MKATRRIHHRAPDRRRSRGREIAVAAWVLMAVTLPPAPIGAQEKRSASEIAAELSNPNTTLGSLSFNFDYKRFGGDLVGAGDQTGFSVGFQPSLPYSLGEGLNLFVRPNIPVVFSQGVPTSSGFEDVGIDLGEIGFDVAVGKTLSGGWLVVGGLVGTLPTSTNDALGKDQFALGPEAVLAKVAPWGVVGVLLTHQWDVSGGAEGTETNTTAGQYFWTVNLSDGWQLGGAPTFAYDHTAAEGQRWLFPIGAGIKKTTTLGATPLRLAGEYWYYLAKPDAFGPSWQVRFVITPVVPLPW